MSSMEGRSLFDPFVNICCQVTGDLWEKYVKLLDEGHSDG